MKNPAILILILLLSGCGKTSIDNTDPNIEVFLINGTDQINTHTVGSNLNIELYITDNEQLQEVVIKIENISNGALSQAQKLLHFQVFGDIDSKTFSEVISVPSGEEKIAGRYQILLQVVDANGNVDTSNKEFVLLNPSEQPEVIINGYTPPEVDGLITLHPSDTLFVNGVITDSIGLANFTVSLTGPQNLHNDPVTINEADFTHYDFLYLGNPVVPQDAIPGDYSFNVEVTNVGGHMIFFAQPVKIE